jgi:hypothetical protein
MMSHVKSRLLHKIVVAFKSTASWIQEESFLASVHTTMRLLSFANPSSVEVYTLYLVRSFFKSYN